MSHVDSFGTLFGGFGWGRSRVRQGVRWLSRGKGRVAILGATGNAILAAEPVSAMGMLE